MKNVNHLDIQTRLRFKNILIINYFKFNYFRDTNLVVTFRMTF